MDVLETSRSMGVLVLAVSVIGHRCLGHRRRGVVRGGDGGAPCMLARAAGSSDFQSELGFSVILTPGVTFRICSDLSESDGFSATQLQQHGISVSSRHLAKC